MLINQKYNADHKYKYKHKNKHKYGNKLGQVGRSLGCCGHGLGNNGGAGLPSEARADIPIELDCQV